MNLFDGLLHSNNSRNLVMDQGTLLPLLFQFSHIFESSWRLDLYFRVWFMIKLLFLILFILMITFVHWIFLLFNSSSNIPQFFRTVVLIINIIQIICENTLNPIATMVVYLLRFHGRVSGRKRKRGRVLLGADEDDVGRKIYDWD